MEAALASGILKAASGKLGDLIASEFAAIMGVKEDLSDLQDLFGKIASRLLSVGAEQHGQSICSIEKLKDVAYDIEDILYAAQLEAEKQKAFGYGGNPIMADVSCAKPKSIIFHLKMAHKIKAIKKRLATIAKQRSAMKELVGDLPLPVDHPNWHNNMVTGEPSILDDPPDTTIHVREKEKEKIISMLVNSTESILTISIVGLGGSGKTTLAKRICADDKIKGHFQGAIYWVRVSSEFDVSKLRGKLFENFGGKKSDHVSEQHIIKEISEKLRDKMFLLVLDDAWNKDANRWEQFMRFRNTCAPRSRILLTTRDEDVADVVGSTNIFPLKFLEEDESWMFFLQCCRRDEKDMDPEFIEVGKDIVAKCGKLPLAIKTLGGALFGKREIREWQAMRESNLLNLQDKVFGSLWLSYFHLPDDHKQHFLLCSIYPKGYKIDKEQLIDQWIAHDMITLEDGIDSLDLKYEKCFNILVQISFLQDVSETYHGRVECRMHDLVHDLARSILQDEISDVVPDKTTEPSKRCRYFSLINQQENIPTKHFFVKARAIYVNEGNFIPGKLLKNAKYLRSITMENIAEESLFATMPCMKNLRYLAISKVQCKKLPEAITYLWCLQELHITNSWELLELPESIGKLQKLRTLDLSYCTSLKSLPDSVSNCKMISSIVLYRCRQLTMLPNSIDGNKKLRVLRLGRTGINRLPPSITTLANLEILDLIRSEINELPAGMSVLTTLRVLNLERCEKLSGMPVGIGQLTCLQKLELFVVGDGENFARISELRNARGIGGTLTIRNIMYVKNPDNALKGCLKGMNKLQGLSLEWGESIGGVVNAENELAVLNALEPPTSEIKSIEVRDYPGEQFAVWISNQVGVREYHPRFLCLAEVSLSDFPNLKHLEGLIEMPSLRELELRCMPALESISGGPFPSLVKLCLYKLDSLGEVWMVGGDGSLVDFGEEKQLHMQIGGLLSILIIEGCPKLEVKPYLPLSQLECLEFLRSNEKLLPSPCCNYAEGLPLPFSNFKRLGLSSVRGFGCGWELLQHLTTLYSLSIIDCKDLIELPESMRSMASSLRSLEIGETALFCLPGWLWEFQNLQSLYIYGCEKLASILDPPPMPGQVQQRLGLGGSLQTLRILRCPFLFELPKSLGELRTLRCLDICNCSGLSGLPDSLGRLTSLELLEIWQCKALQQLPDSLGRLTSLEWLEISDCKALQQLPESLGELSSLRDLRIMYCRELSRLPDCLGGLSSLKTLSVHCCDALCQLPESLGELRALRTLSISSLPLISSLPQSMRHLVSLQDLELEACDGLQQLPEWLGELRSLRVLDLRFLEGLTHLPRSTRLLASLEELRIIFCPGLASLPDGIQGLTALQKLTIDDCPSLARRCERGKGDDWHHISHVPKVDIRTGSTGSTSRLWIRRQVGHDAYNFLGANYFSRNRRNR